MATYTATITFTVVVGVKARTEDAAQVKIDALADKLHEKLETPKFVRQASIESVDDLDEE